MAHDLKGQKLKVRDKVNVPCIVEGIEGEGVTLRPRHVAPGDAEASIMVLHSKQVKKSEAKG
jgi:hypothetical protein